MSSKAEAERNIKTDGATSEGKDKDEEDNCNNSNVVDDSDNDGDDDDSEPELVGGRPLETGPSARIAAGVNDHPTLPRSQLGGPGAFSLQVLPNNDIVAVPRYKHQHVENDASVITSQNHNSEAMIGETEYTGGGGGGEGGPTTVPDALCIRVEETRQRPSAQPSSKRYLYLTVACAVVVAAIVVGIVIAVSPPSSPSSLPLDDDKDLINMTKPVEEPKNWTDVYKLCLPQSYSREGEGLLQNLLNHLSLFVTTEEAANLEVVEMSQQDICSPQYLALTAMMFMLNDRNQNATAITSPITRERYDLAVLFFATAGPTWKNQTNWLSHEHSPCEWHGVTCGSDETEVIQLSFDQNGLDGSIPDELFNLTSLQSLHFYEEINLLAPIPPTIVHLTNLIHFRCHESATGGIPSELGLLTRLRHLYIGGRLMLGVIPSSLGRLTELETLDLQSGGFGGTVPSEIANLSNLKRLVLGGRYTGHFPDQIMERISLHELALNSQSGAGIQGYFSDAMFESDPNSWRFLTLHNNQWSGTIPNSIGKATRLEKLRLSKVAMTGTIPTELGLCTRLTQLQLTDAGDLDGTLPSELGGLTRLTNLRVTDPAVNSTIPATFLQLTNLIHLQLGSGITGSIPAGICDHGLQQLVVSDQSSLCDSCRLMECCSC